MKVMFIMKFFKKSENNLKNLNFFKNVNSKVYEGENQNTKIIDITIEENQQVK